MAMVISISKQMTAEQIVETAKTQHSGNGETLVVLPSKYSTAPLIRAVEAKLNEVFKSVVVMQGPRQTTYSVR